MIKDSDGIPVSAGDTISFSYGIPPVGVRASVVEVAGVLWALTPGHKPGRAKLKDLMRYVGGFWKVLPPKASDPKRREIERENWQARLGQTTKGNAQ